MRKVYLAAVALFVGATANAQNLDFEAGWNAFPVASAANYMMPDNWFGTTLEENPGANSTSAAMRCETENDPTLAAIFAAQLQVPITNNNICGFGQTTVDRLASDPFPTSVDLYYQFSPINNDTAGTILIDVIDTMAAGNQDDVLLAQGIAVYTAAQTTWTMTSIPLNVFQAGTPTTINISCYSSPKDFVTGFPVTLPDPEDGTYLLVDEFTFTGNQASIKEETVAYNINAFPNPASDVFRIELPDSRTNQIDILGMTGQVIKTINVTNLNVNIDLSGLNNGVYMYQLKDNNGKVLTTRKLVVQK